MKMSCHAPGRTPLPLGWCSHSRAAAPAACGCLRRSQGWGNWRRYRPAHRRSLESTERRRSAQVPARAATSLCRRCAHTSANVSGSRPLRLGAYAASLAVSGGRGSSGTASAMANGGGGGRCSLLQRRLSTTGATNCLYELSRAAKGTRQALRSEPERRADAWLCVVRLKGCSIGRAHCAHQHDSKERVPGAVEQCC